MEYNKGTLKPVSIDTELFNEDDFDNLRDNGFVIIHGDVYQVDWIVKHAEEPPEVLNVKENDDGSISFETYHYNGGAHWTEVVEGAIK